MSSATSPRPESVTSSMCALSRMTSASASSTSPIAASATGSVFIEPDEEPDVEVALGVAHREIVELFGGKLRRGASAIVDGHSRPGVM